MTGVVVAFGLAIPNVLSQALLAYRGWRAVPGPCSGSVTTCCSAWGWRLQPACRISRPLLGGMRLLALLLRPASVPP